jgi:hypothetical protein
VFTDQVDADLVEVSDLVALHLNVIQS